MRAPDRGRLEGDRRVLQVSDVLRAIEDQFHIAFPRRVWVFGTVHGLRGDHDLEFLLTEASAEVTGEESPRTLPCELDATSYGDIDDSLRRLHDVAVQDLLVEGHLIRAGGLLSYDTTRHTVIFSITALDPQPTAAWLDDRRQAIREALEEARLGERQRDVQVPLAPRFVGLVGAQDDPAVEEVRRILTGAGFDIEVTDYPVRETGIRQADGLANALREASLGSHDVVLLVRDYGRPLALAPFDAEPVVRAVAAAPVPILTGLGAPEVPAAVESIAHQAYPTARDAADALLRKLGRAAELVETAVEQVSEAGDEALRRAARRVEETRQRVAADVRQARERAEAARRRRLLRIRIAAGVAAVLIVLAAVLSKTYVLLVALVVPLALALFSERLRPQRRRPPVSVTDLSFSAALQRLGNIRRDLDDVADPDVVDHLEQEAAQLAEHCRSLLRRPRPLRARPVQSVATDDDMTAPASAGRRDGGSPDDDATAALPGQQFDDGSGRDSGDWSSQQYQGQDYQGQDYQGQDYQGQQYQGEDYRQGEDRTEQISPQRTMVVPGDEATSALPTTEQTDVAPDRDGRDDDAPTSVLHRRS